MGVVKKWLFGEQKQQEAQAIDWNQFREKEKPPQRMVMKTEDQLHQAASLEQKKKGRNPTDLTSKPKSRLALLNRPGRLS